MFAQHSTPHRRANVVQEGVSRHFLELLFTQARVSGAAAGEFFATSRCETFACASCVSVFSSTLSSLRSFAETARGLRKDVSVMSEAAELFRDEAAVVSAYNTLRDVCTTGASAPASVLYRRSVSTVLRDFGVMSAGRIRSR